VLVPPEQVTARARREIGEAAVRPGPVAMNTLRSVRRRDDRSDAGRPSRANCGSLRKPGVLRDAAPPDRGEERMLTGTLSMFPVR
jgi:hypothetical protein